MAEEEKRRGFDSHALKKEASREWGPGSESSSFPVVIRHDFRSFCWLQGLLTSVSTALAPFVSMVIHCNIMTRKIYSLDDGQHPLATTSDSFSKSINRSAAFLITDNGSGSQGRRGELTNCITVPLFPHRHHLICCWIWRTAVTAGGDAEPESRRHIRPAQSASRGIS